MHPGLYQDLPEPQLLSNIERKRQGYTLLKFREESSFPLQFVFLLRTTNKIRGGDCNLKEQDDIRKTHKIKPNDASEHMEAAQGRGNRMQNCQHRKLHPRSCGKTNILAGSEV